MAAKVAAAALDAPVTWEPSVSYAEFFEGTYKFLVDNVAKTQSNYNFPKDAVEDMHKCLNNLEWFDLSLIIVLAIAWTILRYVCTVFLFTVCKRCVTLLKWRFAEMEYTKCSPAWFELAKSSSRFARRVCERFVLFPAKSARNGTAKLRHR